MGGTKGQESNRRVTWALHVGFCKKQPNPFAEGLRPFPSPQPRPGDPLSPRPGPHGDHQASRGAVLPACPGFVRVSLSPGWRCQPCSHVAALPGFPPALGRRVCFQLSTRASLGGDFPKERREIPVPRPPTLWAAHSLCAICGWDHDAVLPKCACVCACVC